MEMILRQGVRLQQGIALRLGMRTKLEIELQHALVGALYGGSFTPTGDCLKCGKRLTRFEILKGFNDDPRDYTTECPQCKHRFEPRLHRVLEGGSMEVGFLCPAQTLACIAELVDFPLEEIQTCHANAYHSAILHFGGLGQAFAELGLVYTHAAQLDWRNAVTKFLGKMPDTVIAKLVGASVTQVRNHRIKLRITSYGKRKRGKKPSRKNKKAN